MAKVNVYRITGPSKVIIDRILHFFEHGRFWDAGVVEAETPLYACISLVDRDIQLWVIDDGMVLLRIVNPLEETSDIYYFPGLEIPEQWFEDPDRYAKSWEGLARMLYDMIPLTAEEEQRVLDLLEKEGHI